MKFMKKLFLFLAFFIFTQSAQAEVIIFACEPEWASLAREIVGNKARVLLATKANEDPSNVRVTTDMLKFIRTADMVFCSGHGLEATWLNAALNKSGNLTILTRPNNLLFAFDYAVTKSSSARIHLNPYNIASVAAEFTKRIKIIDGLNANFYQKSYENFSVKWQKSIAIWQSAAAPLKDMRVVVQNDNWQEMIDWLGLKVAIKIEPQKTRLANNKILEDALRVLKEKPASAIIFANYEEKASVMWLGEKSRTRIVLLPFTVGGAANSADLFQLFSTTINLLRADCSRVVCPPMVIN